MGLRRSVRPAARKGAEQLRKAEKNALPQTIDSVREETERRGQGGMKR